MRLEEFKAYVDEVGWVFAKTYAKKAPHWYVLKHQRPDLREQFEYAHLFIEKFGIAERYYGTTYTCFYFEGWKYWTLGYPCYEAILWNRTNLESCQRFDITWKPQPGYTDTGYYFDGEVTLADMTAICSGLKMADLKRDVDTGQQRMELWL